MFKIVGVFVALTMFVVQCGAQTPQSVANSVGECIDVMEELVTLDIGSVMKRVLGPYQSAELTLVDCMNTLTKMNRKMEKGLGSIEGKLDDVIHAVAVRMPTQMANTANMQEAQRIAGRVDTMWRRCFRVLTDVGDFSNSTVMDCIQGITSTEGNTVSSVVYRLYDMVVGSGGVRFSDTFWETLLMNSGERTWEEQTNKETSIQYDMYQLHKIILRVVFKAFEMILAAYFRLAGLKQESYEREIRFTLSELLSLLQDFLATCKVALSNADRTIMMGDPKEHVEGVTYEEMEHLFYLRPMREEESETNTECKSTCSDMSYDGWKQESIDGPNWNNRPCFGPMYDCHWMGPATVCSTPGEDRFYKYITSGYGTWGSTTDGCPGWKYDMGTRIIWFWRCDVCFCTCNTQYDTEYADRMISLMPQTCNTTNNEVLVGMRFTKKDQMIHLQIRCGQLGPEGMIVEEAGDWKPTPAMEHVGGSDYGEYYVTEEGQRRRMEQNKDYFHVTREWNHWFLDDIRVDPGHLVLGATLELATFRETADAVRLALLQGSFDFATGKLSADEGDTASTWKTSDNMHDPPPVYDDERMELVLNHVGEPLNCKTNKPRSDPNQYVRMDRTNAYDNSGQKTAPHFYKGDLWSRYSPLSGAELLLLAGDECGGFLSFRLHTLDLSKQMKIHASEDDYEKLNARRE